MTMTIEDIAANGIVGAGGAGFPTNVKLKSKAQFFIVNAAECEPLLHKDKELMIKETDAFITGLKTASSLVGAQRTIIGLKKKYPKLIEYLKGKVPSGVEVIGIEDFYPAGDEVTLIHQVTGIALQPGALPISEGCVVQNVETLVNIGRGEPVVDKYITVAGAVDEPASVRVPIGTDFGTVLSKFSITARNFEIIVGGLMMGRLAENMNESVTKRTGGLIVLPSDHYCVDRHKRYMDPKITDIVAKASCDQCYFCTELCPRYMLGHPIRPETSMRNRIFQLDENGNARVNEGSAFCCECNLCTMFSCPEGLDPKGSCVIEKKILREQNRKWEGLPTKPHPMAEYRKTPTSRLMQKLDVMKYHNKGPLKELDFLPSRVDIPLIQHIGKAAFPVKKKGDKVRRGELIASADGPVSANIHASIDGRISEVGEYNIVIERY